MVPRWAALEPADDRAAAKCEKCGQAGDAMALGDRRALVDVDFEQRGVLRLGGERGKGRRDLLARAAPRREEVSHDEPLRVGRAE